MTPECVQTIHRMEAESEEFADLTAEQLLYACIKAFGLDDTIAVLEHTDWSSLLSGDGLARALH